METFNGLVKIFFLAVILRGYGAIKYFGRSEVCEDAFEFEARRPFVLARKTFDVRGAMPRRFMPVSTLRWKPNRTLGQFFVRCGGIECGQLFAANDGWRYLVGEKLRFFAGPETRKRENRLAKRQLCGLVRLRRRR